MNTVEEAIQIVDEFVKHLGAFGHIPEPNMVLDCYSRVWSTMYIQSSKNCYGNGNSGPKNEAKDKAKPVTPGPEDDPIVAALKSMDGWGYPDKIAKALDIKEEAVMSLVEISMKNGKVYQAKRGYYALADKPKK